MTMSTIRQNRWEIAFAFASSNASGIDDPERFADEYETMSEDLDNVIFYPDRPSPTPEDFAYFYA